MMTTKKDLVLDIGATVRYFSPDYPYPENLIVLNNNFFSVSELLENRMAVIGDGLKLPFKDKSIDIVFSNAVIEHVGGKMEQQLFASEIRRVAKNYFVATPNRFFFYEAHYHLPFYQFVPKKIQKTLSKYFRVGAMKKGHWVDINLASVGDLKKLFPEAKILKTTFSIHPEILIACFKEEKN